MRKSIWAEAGCSGVSRAGPMVSLSSATRHVSSGDGLVRHGTWRCLNVVGGLLSWIASRRCVLADLDERMVERYLRHRAGSSPSSLATERR